MVPFIIRFAKLTEQNTINSEYKKLEYDTKIESNVIPGSPILAVRDPVVRINYTGSFFTKANNDPTRDEETDR
jgi:hypothetical protein